MDHPTEAVLKLLEDNGEQLHALLVRLTLREDVAEDLMQELFLKLARGDRLLHARDALAYAIRAAANLAFDWRRAQKRRPRTESTEKGENVPARSPAGELIASEEIERVLSALDCLPRRDRDLIVMRYLQERNYGAMAHRLGRTPHQVRALCHKAVRRLRRIVEKSPSPQRDDGGIPK